MECFSGLRIQTKILYVTGIKLEIRWVGGWKDYFSTFPRPKLVWRWHLIKSLYSATNRFQRGTAWENLGYLWFCHPSCRKGSRDGTLLIPVAWMYNGGINKNKIKGSGIQYSWRFTFCCKKTGKPRMPFQRHCILTPPKWNKSFWSSVNKDGLCNILAA